MSLVANSPRRHPRRNILAAGLAGTAGAAIVGWRLVDGDATVAVPTTTTTVPLARRLDDEVVLNTAVSVHRTLVDLYDEMAASELVTRPSVAAAVERFGADHRHHVERLSETVESMGYVAYPASNALVRATLVIPRLGRATSELDLVRAAHDLERVITQLHVWATRELGDRTLRTLTMGVGSVTGRHAALWDRIGPLDEGAVVTVPDRLPFDEQAVVPAAERLVGATSGEPDPEPGDGDEPSPVAD